MSTRPNFILLVGEDAGRFAGCYADPDARTPRLDRLAAEGCRYDNAFTTAPVCAPSRCTLVTGQYPWSIGAHHMRSRLLKPPRLFTQELRDAGYHVNWQNKTDFNLEPPPEFADERSDWLASLRTGTLPPDKPFFLYKNIDVTHESTMWPEPWEDSGAVRLRLPLRDKIPPHLRPNPDTVRVPAYLPDTPEVRHNIARFFESLVIADMQIGEVLDALDASPYRDNTIVIYLTDHGRGLVREKRWCYDAGLHLSLIVRDPRSNPAAAPGTVSSELVSWVDIAPTILSLGGAPIPANYQGQIFLGPQKGPPRQYVFAGRDRMDEAFDRIRVVRNQRFHYIRNFFPQLPYCQRQRYMEHMETTQVLRELCFQGKLTPAQNLWMTATKPPEELYDAIADPDMVQNLAAQPAHTAILESLRHALDQYLATHRDLGVVPERVLIGQGLVEDRLLQYTRRIEPLPERHRIGVPETVLEMPAG